MEQKFPLSMVKGNQNFDCALDINHLSEMIVEGSARLISVQGEAMTREGLNPVLGLNEDGVVFSTDREILGGVREVFVLDENPGGDH